MAVSTESIQRWGEGGHGIPTSLQKFLDDRGMGSVQRSLAAGVPLCVIPWGRDQKESARRVQLAGAGTMLSRSQLTPERLQQAAATARTLEPGAQRVAEGFRQAGGAAAAVEILEAQMAANGPSPIGSAG